MGVSQMASMPRALQVVEARGDAVQVADAVAVRILKTARINFVDDGVLPPVLILVGRGCALLGEGSRAENQRNDDTREAAGRCFHFVVHSQRNGAALWPLFDGGVQINQ
jgi:hypothetical protein